MFLNKFDNYKKENLLKLVAIILCGEKDTKNLENLLDESGLKISLEDLIEEAMDIEYCFTNDKDTFMDEILDLCDDIDIKFYVEVSMYLRTILHTPKGKLISNIMVKKLKARDEIVDLCENWVLSMSNYTLVAESIINQ